MSAPITAARNASKSAPKKTQGAMQASGVSQQLFKRHVILGLVKSVNGITEEILPADDDDNNGGDNGHENASKNASTNESGPSDVQKTPGIYPEVDSFCCNCRDFGILVACNTCKRGVCSKRASGGAGCVYWPESRTGEAAKTFSCPDCKMQARQPVDYAVDSYSAGHNSKRLTPCAIISLSLAASKDHMFQEVLQTYFQNEFAYAPYNLHFTSYPMKQKGSKPKLLDPFVKFINSSTYPTNVIVAIDTHADVTTGRLQHGGGVTDPKVESIDKILSCFFGITALRTIQRQRSGSMSGTGEGGQKLYGGAKRGTTGVRILSVLSCGPNMNIEEHRKKYENCIELGFFDVVIGFAGSSTIPSSVAFTLTKFLAEIVIEQERNPWAAASRIVASDQTLLKHVPVVLIYADPRSENRRVISRCIGFHCPPLRTFGADFTGCATDGCQPMTRDIMFNTKNGSTPKEKVRQCCMRCGWKSVWITWKELDFLKPIASSQPRVYWHTFPMTPLQRMSFVAISLARGGEKKQVVCDSVSNGVDGDSRGDEGVGRVGGEEDNVVAKQDVSRKRKWSTMENTNNKVRNGMGRPRRGRW